MKIYPALFFLLTPCAFPQSIASLDAEIASGKHGYVDSLLVIHHDKVVFERSYPHDYDQIYGDLSKKAGPLNSHDSTGPYNYFNPWWHPYYRRGDLHTMQSVTKTVTSIVIGIAVMRKEFPDLDTPILKYFDAFKVRNVDDRKRHLTIRHLLTMTSGLDWNENLPYADPNNAAMLMEESPDWAQFTIDRPMAAEPGSVFNYNSGVTQLLSHIFKVATGHDIEEYAAKNLFTPLGIEYFWKRAPSGLADCEGGLYLNPHGLAKLGTLFLQNGMWNNQRILDADWIKASVTPANAEARSSTKYGFQWWLYPYGPNREHLAWSATGWGGQGLIVVPDHDLIIVFTGWNILPGQPGLSHRTALDQILKAIQ